MRQIYKTDPLDNKRKKITLIRVVETDKTGKTFEIEMPLRHALQAMRVSDNFKLAKGEKLPKGIEVSMVPPGTSSKDIEKFELSKGSMRGIKKTNFDTVLDALERGIDISEDDNPLEDLTQPPVKIEVEKEDPVLKNARKETPELEDIDKGEVDFSEKEKTVSKYSRSELIRMNKDQLQAIAINLPRLTVKMKKGLLISTKEGLIDSILQLSKI